VHQIVCKDSDEMIDQSFLMMIDKYAEKLENIHEDSDGPAPPDGANVEHAAPEIGEWSICCLIGEK
jgi:hypothetical protein